MALRARCMKEGIGFERGYVRGGEVVDEDSVTCLHDGDGYGTSLTFEEGADGALWCADDMGVGQATGAFLAGRTARKVRRTDDGLVGRTTCSWCGGRVRVEAKWCEHCGRRFD